MALYRHQIDGVNFLSGRRRALLADEQGLGKTATAICAADQVGARKLLVLTPTVVASNWCDEIQRWSPGRATQLVRTSRTKFVSTTVVLPHSLIAKQAIQVQIRNMKPDVVIVDEAHAFRTPTAQRTRAVFGHTHHYGVFYDAPKVWYLTGTPMLNNPSDLWGLIKDCAPEQIWLDGPFRPMNYREFIAAFCTTRPNPFARGQVIVTGVRNAERLKSILSTFSLRRLKSDHLSLPPKIWGTVALEGVAPPEAPAVDLSDLDALRRSVSFAEYRRTCGIIKARVAASYITQELESENSLVVFAHHREALDVLQLELERNDVSVRRIDGATPTLQRGLHVADFQRGTVRVMLCNIQAAGVGITLTASRRVVFLEQSWLPGENAQAADRCHRIGQTGVVSCTVLTLRGTADAEVDDALMRRTAMINAVQG